jgi:hypothetical protein
VASTDVICQSAGRPRMDDQVCAAARVVPIAALDNKTVATTDVKALACIAKS